MLRLGDLKTMRQYDSAVGIHKTLPQTNRRIHIAIYQKNYELH